MQWLYLPVFMIYRVLLFLYILVWLILHIYTRRNEFGPHWLIFITDLGYSLLTITMGLMAILCVVYGIVYYTRRAQLLRFFPKKDFPLTRVYKQDNIPWYVKIVWLMYTMSSATAILVFAGYYIFVYEPCDGDSGSTDGMNVTSNGGSGDMQETNCSVLDAETIHVHGVNVLVVLLDLFVSRMPYQFLHFCYATLFSFLYAIFSLIYFGAGGTNHLGRPYIYSSLDYGNSPGTAAGLAIVLVVVCIPLHLLLFLLAWLRDVIFTRIGCCFRDIKQSPFRESFDAQMDENGAEELTKV